MRDAGKRIGELIEGQELVVVAPQDAVRDVAKVMTEHNIGAVAVVADSALAGIFTERDLLRRVVAEDRDTAIPVSEFMTRDVISIEPEDVIEDAIVTMKLKGFRHMPVVTRDNKLVAMLSLRDLLQADRERMHDKADLLNRLVRQDPIYDG